MRVSSKFISMFRISKDRSLWTLTSNREEQYSFWLYIGKVKRENDSGFLIIFGPLYYIFGWNK